MFFCNWLHCYQKSDGKEKPGYTASRRGRYDCRHLKLTNIMEHVFVWHSDPNFCLFKQMIDYWVTGSLLTNINIDVGNQGDEYTYMCLSALLLQHYFGTFFGRNNKSRFRAKTLFNNIAYCDKPHCRRTRIVLELHAHLYYHKRDRYILISLLKKLSGFLLFLF